MPSVLNVYASLDLSCQRFLRQLQFSHSKNGGRCGKLECCKTTKASGEGQEENGGKAKYLIMPNLILGIMNS